MKSLFRRIRTTVFAIRLLASARFCQTSKAGSWSAMTTENSSSMRKQYMSWKQLWTTHLTLKRKTNMRKNAFVAIDHIKAINIFRVALNGSSFTKEELKKTLKDGGIPSNEVFISALRRSPILIQVGKDQFKFATPQRPVYHGVLDRIYKDYQSKTNAYQRTYREKKKQEATSAA